MVTQYFLSGFSDKTGFKRHGAAVNFTINFMIALDEANAF
jgi:hypothetical protein